MRITITTTDTALTFMRRAGCMRSFPVAVVAVSCIWALMTIPHVALAVPAPGTSGLVRASGPAVYYVARDGKRYVFPNEHTYRTWYTSFRGVRQISDVALAAFPVGGAVTYKPGARMVKVQSDPRVYAVARGGVLRWVSSETLAVELYGSVWSSLVDDLPSSFFSHYTIGAPISAAGSFNPAVVQSKVMDIDADRLLMVSPYQSRGRAWELRPNTNDPNTSRDTVLMFAPGTSHTYAVHGDTYTFTAGTRTTCRGYPCVPISIEKNGAPFVVYEYGTVAPFYRLNDRLTIVNLQQVGTLDEDAYHFDRFSLRIHQVTSSTDVRVRGDCDRFSSDGERRACERFLDRQRDVVKAIEHATGIGIGECYSEVIFRFLLDQQALGFASTDGVITYSATLSDSMIVEQLDDTHELLHLMHYCVNFNQPGGHQFFNASRREIELSLGNNVQAAELLSAVQQTQQNFTEAGVPDASVGELGGCEGAITYTLQGVYLAAADTRSIVRAFYGDTMRSVRMLRDVPRFVNTFTLGAARGEMEQRCAANWPL